MGDNGLQGSRWANRGSGGNYFNRSVGNWTCNFCGALIPLSQSSCSQCQHPSQTNGGQKRSSNGMIPRKTDSLYLSPVSSTNDATVILGNGSRLASAVPTTTHQRALGGLSMSRWAPRANQGTRKEVWTRTIPASIISVPTHIHPNQLIHPAPPDLGLPYQVQHYILGMIQRILEEACYEFAARWIPQILHGKGWDCAEAVELSNWKAFLPTAIPPHSIKSLANYSLETALGDAVRIRNSAVHRHLCDTEEIRKMALQARDLMLMFSDVTRQNKFHMLWEELGKWGRQGGDDPQSARSQLEEALKEISERPVDDMDWTPNAVSLQEIPETGVAEVEESVDEMELD